MLPSDNAERLSDLVRFYALLDRLEQHLGERRLLSGCHGRMSWPKRGVYFFMENGEQRRESGIGLRVVRVGTHALSARSRTTLWLRLSHHKGRVKGGGGNHRGSIFRLLVGSTLLKDSACATWGVNSSAPRDIRLSEDAIEQEVSRIIGAMPFLWLAADDAPSRDSVRGVIERNSIALLSNLEKPPLDPPSATWRGRGCDRGKARVRDSGLWNQNHVDENYDPAFLDVMKALVERT
jgi:hypothetical protein